MERSARLTTGLLLIAVGLLFLADHQGWSWGLHLTFRRLWPLMLVFAGLPKVIVPIDEPIADPAGQPGATVRRYRLGSGFWMVSMGVLFLLHVNQVLRLEQSWPLLIVAGGVTIIFSDRRRSRRRRER